MTFSIMALNAVMLSVYVECHLWSVVTRPTTMSVIMLSVVMLSVVMLNVVATKTWLHVINPNNKIPNENIYNDNCLVKNSL
jgi:hypothetical protein